MAKFAGYIGFTITNEVESGKWKSDSVEKRYVGDILRNIKRYDTSNKINDDLNITNEISIISDSFMDSYLYCMKYVVLNGIKWKITNFNIAYPRIILTLGGVYNESSE